MSKAGYDGERCEGCVACYPDCCDSIIDGDKRRDSLACNQFKPTLQCRQVRAEEEANQLRRERNGLLERIADSLETWTPVTEADLDDIPRYQGLQRLKDLEEQVEQLRAKANTATDR